jgi:hypothetical protein
MFQKRRPYHFGYSVVLWLTVNLRMFMLYNIKNKPILFGSINYFTYLCGVNKKRMNFINFQ